MVSRILLILSLVAIPVFAFADTAADYAHRGAQKYIFGDDDAAKAEFSAGLAKFPNDPELQKMAKLIHPKKPKPPSKQNKDQQDKDQQDKQDQQQQQQQQKKDQQGKSGKNQKEQQQNGPSPSPSLSPNQSPSPSPSPGQSPSPSPSPGETASPSPSAGESPSPSPSPEENQQQNAGDSGETPTPTPGEKGNEQSPSPKPGEGDQSAKGASPSPTPDGLPEKKFAGDVKSAGEEKGDNKSQQMAAMEPAKEGEMTRAQAMRLLQSMKDEEQRVQLDERKAVRPVYNDW